MLGANWALQSLQIKQANNTQSCRSTNFLEFKDIYTSYIHTYVNEIAKSWRCLWISLLTDFLAFGSFCFKILATGMGKNGVHARTWGMGLLPSTSRGCLLSTKLASVILVKVNLCVSCTVTTIQLQCNIL